MLWSHTLVLLEELFQYGEGIIHDGHIGANPAHDSACLCGIVGPDAVELVKGEKDAVFPAAGISEELYSGFLHVEEKRVIAIIIHISVDCFGEVRVLDQPRGSLETPVQDLFSMEK